MRDPASERGDDDPGALDGAELARFVESTARAWGARRDVVRRLEFAALQTAEAAVACCEPKGLVRLAISYDEFVVDAMLTYHGPPLGFPARPPSGDEIIETEDGHRRLAGFLIRRFADQVRATEMAIRRCCICPLLGRLRRAPGCRPRISALA